MAIKQLVRKKRERARDRDTGWLKKWTASWQRFLVVVVVVLMSQQQQPVNSR